MLKAKDINLFVKIENICIKDTTMLGTFIYGNGKVIPVTGREGP
jgi:hypothetical protein